MSDIKHDLLLLLKCILTLPFLLIIFIIFVLSAFSWLIRETIGFRTPLNVLDNLGNDMDYFWNKLPKFGSED